MKLMSGGGGATLIKDDADWIRFGVRRFVLSALIAFSFKSSSFLFSFDLAFEPISVGREHVLPSFTEFFFYSRNGFQLV